MQVGSLRMQQPREILFVSLIIVFFVLGLVISSLFSFELYYLGSLFAVPFVYLSFRFPKFWVLSSILMFGPILMFRDEGISHLEIVFSVYVLGGLAIYFVSKLLIRGQRLVLNFGDFAIVSFFILVPFNAIFAYLNDVDMFRWLREILVIILFLFYFPIRDYFKKESDFKILLFVVSIVLFFVVINSYIIFQKRVLEQAIYAYELGKSIIINQIFLIFSIFTSILLYLYLNNFWIRLYLLVVAFCASATLLITYTRTFWVIAVVEILSLFFLMKRKERLRLVWVLGFATVLIIFASLFVFKENAKIFFKVVEARFESTSRGRKDKSLMSRLAEYPVVWRGIKENPFWGNGFAKKIHFRDPIHVANIWQHNIHSSYTSYVFRAGIPLALVFFTFFFYYVGKSIYVVTKQTEPFRRALALSALLTFVAIIIANNTNAHFLHREGIFTVALCIAMVEFSANNLRLQNDN